MRFSVVIPTHGRRDVVVANVAAFARQSFADFEVIVTVDGSNDGTADALRALDVPFELTVVEQRNQGAAVARNAGAAVARGELLLFLDDDMEPDPEMLAEHDRSHRAGAALVFGDVPLHPHSPNTAIAAATGRWAQRRSARLSAPGAEPAVTDLLTGQMSIGRADFERLGRFDVSFTQGGLVPGADHDFGHRARRAGLRLVFNPAAISHQYYDVDAATYTRRTRNGAWGAQVLSTRYPEIAEHVTLRSRFDSRRSRLVLGTLAAVPAALSWPLRELAIRLFSRPDPGRRARELFWLVQKMERARGAREARRALRNGQVVVLAYHSISDLSGDPILAKYGVPPERFAAQLDALGRRRRFVSIEEFLRALDGVAVLPRRALLLTFDDAYTDLLEAACPLLSQRGIPAIVFAVSDLIGGTNTWRRSAARELALLDAGGLRELGAHGVAAGSHGATHRPLPALEAAELDHELSGSAQRLEACGLPRPRVFSYPHGEWTAEVAEAVRGAGYAAAFTVIPGVARRQDNRYALPRVEVLASDSPRRLRFKVASAGWPAWLRLRLLRLVH